MLHIKVATEDLVQVCFQTKEGQLYLHPGKHLKLPGCTQHSTRVTPVTYFIPSSQLPRWEIVTAFAQTRKEAPENSAFFPEGRPGAFMQGLWLTELWSIWSTTSHSSRES